MHDYERGNRSPKSPISKNYEYYLSNEIVQNKKIIKFYRILFGLQITIILIYYIYNLCV